MFALPFMGRNGANGSAQVGLCVDRLPRGTAFPQNNGPLLQTLHSTSDTGRWMDGKAGFGQRTGK